MNLNKKSNTTIILKQVNGQVITFCILLILAGIFCPNINPMVPNNMI